MQFLVDHNHNFFVDQSFGKVGFDATIVTVTLDSYLGGQCGSLAENALGYWMNPDSPDPNYLDVQLNARVLEDYGKPYLRVHCLQLLVHDGDLFHEHLSTTSPFPPIKASMRWWTLTTRSTPFPIVVPCPGLALDGWGYPVHSFRSRVLLTTRRSLMKSATTYVSIISKACTNSSAVAVWLRCAAFKGMRCALLALLASHPSLLPNVFYICSRELFFEQNY